MKKIKLLMLLIVMLLSSSKSWCQNDSSTGEFARDSTSVVIPLELLRKANIKLIERKYYINIVEEQDSIIKLKDEYINRQDDIIKDFQNRIAETNKINNQIKDSYIKEHKRNKIIKITSVATIAALVIGVIIK